VSPNFDFGYAAGVRAVVQRVSSASVLVEGEVTGKIGEGLCVLVGVGQGDTADDARWLADKIVDLRIFEDEQGKMNRSLVDVRGGVLAISQFTLFGDARKGNRPGFVDAARPENAQPLYAQFCELVRGRGVQVEEGVFRATMQVRIVNEGPVTLLLDSKRLF
jgi:D-tyrosyl-tRNA(Tyr) deacylase